MAYCTSYSLNIIAFLAFTTLPHILGTPKGTHKLSLPLIHRYSIFPPTQKDDIRVPVMPHKSRALFLVNISIGSPPVPQLLAMDTGSYLTWTRCNCNNCFDPRKSSTYKDVPSDAPPCTSFDYGADAELSPCPFDITYLDSSFSKGSLAFETYTFMTSSDGTVQVSDAVLGCAHETNPPDFEGVLGLVATTPYHLLSHTGNKFSYCIGNISDPQYMHSRLILGDGAVIQGYSTPMQVRRNNYMVSLKGISVGDTLLTINPIEFEYNVVLDSGSTYTTLIRSAYQPLADQIMSLGQIFFVTQIRIPNVEENQLCYQGDPQRDLKGFPIVSLHLAGGADIDLDVEGLFQRSNDGSAFCMAIIESNENMIGLMAQQYYNVGFDVGADSISLQRIDCELLDD